MPTKSTVFLLIAIGSTVGSYLPTIIGADFLSFWSLVGGLVGGIFGIWLAFKISPS